ncbi:MAG: PKD domain-containing protein [Thermoanaerobaculia bacterium]
MTPFSGLLKMFAVFGLSILAGVTAVTAPSASFQASTPNPAANSVVQFTDTSTGGPTSWAWDFGDGTTSTAQSPTHAYAAPGAFTVRLTASNASGPATSTLAVTVTPDTVLRLNAAHTFDLTLTANDPRTGNTGSGKVIGQNDVYGYFSIPAVSGNAGNPEVIVKMVDATGIGQNYWVFYGCMTDLEYTLSVKENATGVVKRYAKDLGKPCGQFDTSGFLPIPVTEDPPPTPSPTPTPTPTPGPAGAIVVTLTARQFQWDFDNGGSAFVAKVGTKYELHIKDIDARGNADHAFSGIPALGLSGTNLPPQAAAVIRTFTPTAAQVGFHPFGCSNTGCGIGHDGMTGVIQVVR